MAIKPILMHPAWRQGDLTPWGGERLRALYGKTPPGDRAGESLELSAIPGLESRDEAGKTLTELISQLGSRLTGSGVGAPFPLLIKLIDAKERLSVQVHPDDAYAKERHGKLGKNEAWHILDARPGARLVLGLREGTGAKQLEAAALRGAATEGLLREVAVRAGETYYIPAGTVHAIGGGITLYEIQQSSDVTYRLYDWGRVDARGQGRELHLQDSLAVAKPDSRPDAARPVTLSKDATGARERLLDTPYFQLDKLGGCDGLRLAPDLERFSALTALAPMRLRWPGGEMHLKGAQTALLPAYGYPLEVYGEAALLASPAVR